MQYYVTFHIIDYAETGPIVLLFDDTPTTEEVVEALVAHPYLIESDNQELIHRWINEEKLVPDPDALRRLLKTEPGGIYRQIEGVIISFGAIRSIKNRTPVEMN